MRGKTISVIFAAVLAAITLSACGSAQPASDTTAYIPAPTVTSEMATGASTSKPTPASTSSSMVSREKLAPLLFEDVAFVELTHPSLLTISAEDRRILSPAGDSGVVMALLDAYSLATVVPGEDFPRDRADLKMIIHLRSGSALVFWWQPDGREIALVDGYEGTASNIPEGDALHGPSVSREVRAPDLLQAAEMAALPRDTEAGSSPEAGLLTVMPDDFGFVAAFGVYGKMVLDTFTGTFHKDMVLPQNTTSTASLSLTPAELRDAYARLVALDLLGYPTDFIPQQTGGVTPNEEYYLRIMAGGVEKEIRWDDTTLSDDHKAVALRDWFKWLQELIYERPEYKALPDFRGGYA
jgi:hypothetical protein